MSMYISGVSDSESRGIGKIMKNKLLQIFGLGLDIKWNLLLILTRA